MKEFDLLENIRRRFERYQTYYQILGLKKENLTDEQVKEAYDRKCYELKMMLKDCKGKELEKVEDVIKSALDDAYTALKTESSRKNYEHMLSEIEEMEK